VETGYKIAGLDVHKKMLAVVVCDSQAAALEFERRRFGSTVSELRHPRKGDKKLFEVAKAVGYDSDAAFSKAFKRIFGVPPKEYERPRRELRSDVNPSALRGCNH
jgi:AraC-like DNA-binding protein